MKPNEEYQGWSNSSTWSAAYLIGQERPAYEAIVKVRREEGRVDGKLLKYWWDKLGLKKDVWTRGRINWKEIADDRYNKEEFI